MLTGSNHQNRDESSVFLYIIAILILIFSITMIVACIKNFNCFETENNPKNLT